MLLCILSAVEVFAGGIGGVGGAGGAGSAGDDVLCATLYAGDSAGAGSVVLFAALFAEGTVLEGLDVPEGLEMLDVPEAMEVMRRVLRCMREAVGSGLCSPQVLEVLDVLGGAGGGTLCATDVGGTRDVEVRSSGGRHSDVEM